jgi:hypothetical protein
VQWVYTKLQTMLFSGSSETNTITSTLSKVLESYAIEWIYEDVRDKISASHAVWWPTGISAVQISIYLMEKWHLAMRTTGKVIKIVFLDFRKAFDLNDHNKPLKSFNHICVRPALASWFASYLQGRL